MKVLKLGDRPGLVTEQLERAAACVSVGHAIDNVDSMVDSKRPKRDIGNIRPVDGGMMKHGTGNGQHSSNGMLSNSIGVVCSNTRVADSLMELAEMGIKVTTEELGAIVTEVALRNDSWSAQWASKDSLA